MIGEKASLGENHETQEGTAVRFAFRERAGRRKQERSKGHREHIHRARAGGQGGAARGRDTPTGFFHDVRPPLGDPRRPPIRVSAWKELSPRWGRERGGGSGCTPGRGPPPGPSRRTASLCPRAPSPQLVDRGARGAGGGGARQGQAPAERGEGTIVPC